MICRRPLLRIWSRDWLRLNRGAQTDAWANQPEPQDGLGWVNRGMVALERGLLSDAEEAFLEAESFDDSQVLAYEGLGRVYARRPALRQRAVTYFYRALEADTTRADLYYQMASVYFDIGTGQCVDMASRAIAIDSTYSAPYQLLGDWFARDDFYALPQGQCNSRRVLYALICHWNRMMLMRSQSWVLCCCVWRISRR